MSEGLELYFSPRISVLIPIPGMEHEGGFQGAVLILYLDLGDDYTEMMFTL